MHTLEDALLLTALLIGLFVGSLALWSWFTSKLPINRRLESQERLAEVRSRSKKDTK